MTETIALILFFILCPVLILWLCNRFPFLNKIGAIVIAYLLGFALGNAGILSESALAVQKQFTDLTILLAIPLLLFSLNVRSWVRISGKTFLSLILGLAALVVAIVTGHMIWGSEVQDAWKVSGLLTGVYSGGTPNLAAIQKALKVDESLYILTHTYDIILSTLYLFFLITAGKLLIRWFLPSFVSSGKPSEGAELLKATTDNYKGFFARKTLLPLLAALGLAIVILGASAGLSMLVNKDFSTLIAILAITTLGILGSLIPRISRIEKTFELGMYFILIFSLVVASMADFKKFDLDSLSLFYYVGYAIFGTLLLHIILSKIFRVDADTTMITSVSMIFSPPFVPMVAGALRNKEIILSGLITGLIGYAVGNYLGVTLAYLLR